MNNYAILKPQCIPTGRCQQRWRGRWAGNPTNLPPGFSGCQPVDQLNSSRIEIRLCKGAFPSNVAPIWAHFGGKSPYTTGWRLSGCQDGHDNYVPCWSRSAGKQCQRCQRTAVAMRTEKYTQQPFMTVSFLRSVWASWRCTALNSNGRTITVWRFLGQIYVPLLAVYSLAA